MLLNLWYVAALDAEVPRDQPFGVKMLGHDLPKRARIDAYPVAIKYGLVWVFIGDHDESQRAPIPDMFEPYIDSPDWRCIGGKYRFAANWQRVSENGLDTAPVHFVHPAFGNPNAAQVVPAPIVEHQWGARCSNSFAAASIENNSGASRAALEEAGRAAPESRRPSSELQFHLSGLTIQILQTMAPGIAQCILSCDTPIDEYTSMAFWVLARNYKREPEHDADRAAMVQKVYEQDFEVVGLIRPAFVPDERLGARRASDAITVLPSAARARDPAGWVMSVAAREATS